MGCANSNSLEVKDKEEQKIIFVNKNQINEYNSPQNQNYGKEDIPNNEEKQQLYNKNDINQEKNNENNEQNNNPDQLQLNKDNNVEGNYNKILKKIFIKKQQGNNENMNAQNQEFKNNFESLLLMNMAKFLRNNINKYNHFNKSSSQNNQTIHIYQNGEEIHIYKNNDNQEIHYSNNNDNNFDFSRFNKIAHENKCDNERIDEFYQNCMRQNKISGTINCTFCNGDNYSGRFENGKFEGQGIYSFCTGATYIGNYCNGLRDGKGQFNYCTGDKYIGDFVAGYPEGKGEYHYCTGEKYIGEFKSGKKHGRGTFIFITDQKLEGNFENGEYVDENERKRQKEQNEKRRQEMENKRKREQEEYEKRIKEMEEENRRFEEECENQRRRNKEKYERRIREMEEENRRIQEKRENQRRKNKENYERRIKEMEEENRRIQEKYENQRKRDQEEYERKIREMEEENRRIEEEREKKKIQDEIEKKRREEENKRRKQQEENEIKKRKEEYERQIKEKEEKEKKRREEYEKERKRKEEEYERQRKEEEERERKRKEEEEKERKKREEEYERQRKKQEEIERKRREEEEKERKRREEEYERKRKEEEERERKRREEEEKERRRRQEEYERLRKEQEERERKLREEEERRRKEEEDIIQNPQRGRKDILKTLDKEKLKKIVEQCPKRTSTPLNKFKEYFKKATNDLKDEEKAYALFYWMTQNIKYDVEGLFAGKYYVEPEESYSRGMTVCSGYSRLYKNIGDYIGIDVICVIGYAKGLGYKEGQKITGSNHEWNILKFDNVYYQMDSTWGSGSVSGRTFKKKLKEYYFCPEPDRLFCSHYPDEEKWQLIYPYLSVEEFSKRVKFSPEFYKLFTTDCKYTTIKAKSKHTIRFNINNPKEKILSACVVEDGNGKSTKNALCTTINKEDHIEFFYMFKKKGTYKTDIFACNATEESSSHMVTYILKCEEDWKTTPDTPFSLPDIYNDDITIIEPFYNIMKKGKKVTLKLKSDVTDEIIITNKEWLTIKKNKDGIFEATITVKAEEIFIGKKTGDNGFSTSIVYKVNK